MAVPPMSAAADMRFPLLDRFHALRMGLELPSVPAGRTVTVESPRRLGAEHGYGYVRALWWMAFLDGRTVVSVPPGVGEAVGAVLEGVHSADAVFDSGLAERLKVPVDAALRQSDLPTVDRVLFDLVVGCNAALLRRHACGRCERITDPGFPSAPGAELPSQCFPDGVVYGVIAEGRVVSVALAHRTGLMEDCVADLGVGMALGYRRSGYAKTCVSALVGHFTSRGGEARYGCSPDNAASIATARSVGFVPYGRSLILSAPRGDR
jgi:hypothetical protein